MHTSCHYGNATSRLLQYTLRLVNKLVTRLAGRRQRRGLRSLSTWPTWDADGGHAMSTVSRIWMLNPQDHVYVGHTCNNGLTLRVVDGQFDLNS